MITLTRTDPTKNLARFYSISIGPDLFGGYAVTREWGRIGQGGTVRRDPYNDEAAAHQAAATITEQKIRRGYRQPTTLATVNAVPTNSSANENTINP